MQRQSEEGFKYLRKDLPNLEDRKQYCQTLLATKGAKVHDPIPVRVEPCKDTKFKQLFRSYVVSNQPAGILYSKICEHVSLSKVNGMFLYCDDLLVTYNTDLRMLYSKKKDPDGFLYITYGEVNPF